jgi:hypothetical protein
MGTSSAENNKPKVLVTGANGQLGKELRQLEKAWPQFDFLFLSREDLPIHHFELVRNYFEAVHPNYLINCAAYTAVDKAESEKELAYQINAEAVGVLAAICQQQHCRLPIMFLMALPRDLTKKVILVLRSPFMEPPNAKERSLRCNSTPILSLSEPLGYTRRSERIS